MAKRRLVAMYLAPIAALLIAGCAADVLPPAAVSAAAPVAAAYQSPTAGQIAADWRKQAPSWFAPMVPYKLIGERLGGIYYVGTEGLAIYFIPTEAGHIVIDGGMPGQGQYVADAIRTLGFDPRDVKILLNSHAHLDHSGGLAELKEITGAVLLAHDGDRSALEGGFYLGSEDQHEFDTPPVKVDRTIADGEQVTLGNVTLTAHLTPGHSRGCTSWTMDVTEAGKNYRSLFFCSASVAANRLVGPASAGGPQYPGIVDDYRRTFAITKGWRPDIFLANHPEFFNMAAKRAKQQAGDPLAFVDDQGFPEQMKKLEANFEAALAKQQLQYDTASGK